MHTNVPKCWQVTFVMVILWIHLTGCHYYCDDNVGICLYTNSTLATSWQTARHQCYENGSILLEIYNEKYKEVVIKAIQQFGLQGFYLLLGLEYINEQFRWLTGDIMTVSLTVKDSFSGNCNAFLVVSGSSVSISPSCDGVSPSHYFVCLKVNNISTTEMYSTEYSTPKMSYATSFNEVVDNNKVSSNSDSTISHFTSPQITNNISFRELDNNKQQSNGQQQNNNIGIGVGVALSLFSIVLLILIVCILKRRLKNRNKPEEAVRETNNTEIQETAKDFSISPTESFNESHLVYVDINFKDKAFDFNEEDHPIEKQDEVYKNENKTSYYPNDEYNSAK